MRKLAVIGIDLGTDSIKIVALESVGGELFPRVVGAGAAAGRGMRRGAVIDHDELANAVREAKNALEKSTGLKNVEAHVALGGIGLNFQKAKGLVAVSRADGEITKEDMKRASQASETMLSRLQNKEIIHRIPLSYKIDNEASTHDPLGLTGSKLETETFFITVFAQNIKNLLKAMEETDIEVEEIAASPLAASRVALGRREKEIGGMVLDLGASTTSIVLFEEGLPYSLDILPIGSQHITQDIAVGFKVDLDEAEKLKINYGAVGGEAENFSKKPARGSSGMEDLVYGHYSRKKLSEIIEARLSDIFELVEKHLKKVERARLLPAGIFIVGGGANLPGIESFTKDSLDLPVRVAEPENLGGFKDKIKNPAWSVAVGTALMALEKESSTSFFRSSGNPLLRWLRAFLP